MSNVEFDIYKQGVKERIEEDNLSIKNIMDSSDVTIENIINLQIDKICRTCLCEGELKNMFKETLFDNKKVMLPEIISTHFSLNVLEHERLPNKICNQCLDEIYRCYQFKQRCIKTSHILQYYISLKDNCIVNLNSDNCKKIKQEDTLENEDSRSNKKEKEFISETDGCRTLINKQELKEENCNEEDDDYLLNNEKYSEKSRQDIQDHKRHIKQTENKQTCPICKKILASNLKAHLKTHSDEAAFQCENCGQTFSVKANLKRHMMIHSGERPHQCKECSKAFIQLTSLVEHMKVHSGETPFVCDVCGKSYKHDSTLKKHMSKRHPLENGKNSIPPQHQCKMCDRYFQTTGALKKHTLIHGNQNLKCHFCGHGFLTTEQLHVHIKSHNGLYMCNLCEKSFSFKSALKTHMSVHTGSRPYVCDICSKSFSHRGTLKSHLTVHSGDRPFQCKVCGSSFKQMSHLRYHRRIHSGERPYTCEDCGKSFALKGNLTVHKRIHSGETPYMCTTCSKGFHDSSSLRKHKKGHKDILCSE